MRIKRFVTVIAFLFTAFVFTAPVFGAYPQTTASDSPFVNLPRPDDDPRWAKAFSHWDKRGDTDEVMESVRIFEALDADKPGEMYPQMWLCRSYFVLALRNRSERYDYARKSVAAGDKALAISPGDDNVWYWRAAAIVLHREFNEEELEEVRTFGKKYRHLSPLPGINDPMFKQAAQLWNERSDKKQLDALIEVLKKIEAGAPDRVEPKIWLCAAHFTRRMFEDSDGEKAKWAKMGIKYGEAAIEIKPRNPAANYFAACCQGEYGALTNALNIARYSMDIGKELQVIVEEDPQFYFGGFSRYFAAAIGATGPLVAKIADFLGFPEDLIVRISKFAVNYEPDYFSNHYDRAEMLIALDRKKEAKEELLYVLNTDSARLPGYELENRFAKGEARALYNEHFFTQ